MADINQLKIRIIEAVKDTHDEDLLDLILKLIVSEN